MNGGDDAYEHDIYGDEITVERVIPLRGTGVYKLLDHKGKERSRKRRDLDSMLDHLNIQVENPVAILDQEEGKDMNIPQHGFNPTCQKILNLFL